MQCWDKIWSWTENQTPTSNGDLANTHDPTTHLSPASEIIWTQWVRSEESEYEAALRALEAIVSLNLPEGRKWAPRFPGPRFMAVSR
jgi:hypothetical protein